jgi:hypothetical protein
MSLAAYYILPAQFIISGKVTDSSNTVLVNANILLHKASDSSLVKGQVTNAGGLFIFQNIPAEQYFISCSSIGFQTIYIKNINLTGSDESRLDVGTIVCRAEMTQLSQVTVTANKLMFELKPDRMVVNVKSSITSAGGTVLDVLQKSPGVTVNKQAGTISMNGKNGVQVMINGKLNYMPAEALVQMLGGMTANNVETIELITTPPAGMDASGNAGYINIILQKNPDQGFNGSYSLTAAAFHGTAPAASFDFNYRKNKLNFFGSYSFSRLAQKQIVNSYRDVTHQGKSTSTTIRSDRDPFQRNHNVRLGLDYQLSKKTTIGILTAAYNNKWKMDALNTSFSRVNNADDTAITISNDEINHWKHLMGNINLQHHINSTSEFTVNADYLYYDDKNPVNYLNTYYDGHQQILYSEKTRSSKNTTIKILPIQLDYKKKLSAKTYLETGIKSVRSRFTNDILIENLKQNAWVADTDLTGNYMLKENINAAYGSVSINVDKKNTLKAGLRYEHSYSNLGTETKKDIVNRKYGNLFPTLYWSHKINDENNLNISYNRRINRPTFNDLAPFLIFIDPNTFISGNVSLQPSIADAVKLDYAWKRIVFSTGFTYEAHSIAGFQTEIDVASDKLYMTAKNLVYTKTVNASFSIPFSPAKWWMIQLNVVGNWQKAKADYIEPSVSISQFNYTISGFQSFTLPKNYGLELSGFFQSPALFGIAKGKSFGLLNAGIQKKFVKSSSSLKFGVDDIFSTMIFGSVLDLPAENFYARDDLQMSRRIFKITFSRNFGNKILRDKRARITASEEERTRVQ